MNGIAQRVKAVLDMNGIGGTFAQRVKAVLDLTNDRLDHMVTVAGLDPAADLRYGNWRGFDLSGADLRGFDFTGADLTGARFDNAFIAGAIFRNAICDARSLQKAADFEEFLTQLVNEQVVIQRSLVTQEVPNFKDDPHLRDKLALLKDHYLFSKFPLEYIERLAACMVQKSVPGGARSLGGRIPASHLCATSRRAVRRPRPLRSAITRRGETRVSLQP